MAGDCEVTRHSDAAIFAMVQVSPKRMGEVFDCYRQPGARAGGKTAKRDSKGETGRSRNSKTGIRLQPISGAATCDMPTKIR